MPPEPAFLIGLILGCLATLVVQAMRRRVRRNAALEMQYSDIAERERRLAEVDNLRSRLAVLERITVDPAEHTAREIEALRSAN